MYSAAVFSIQYRSMLYGMISTNQFFVANLLNLFERYYSLLLYVHLSPLTRTLKCDLQTLAERIVVIGQMVWQPTVCTPSFVDEPSDRQ